MGRNGGFFFLLAYLIFIVLLRPILTGGAGLSSIVAENGLSNKS